MTRWSFLAVVVAGVAVAAAATGSAPSTQAQKRAVVEVTKIEPIAYVSLEHAYDASDAMLLVRVESHEAVPGVGSTPVLTDYRCSVLDVIKGDVSQAGQEVIVRRLGGVRDEGDVIRRAVIENWDDYTDGDQYVLFLSWKEQLKRYVVGMEGSYGVSDEKLLPHGRSEVSQKSKHDSVRDFIEKLRKLNKKRGTAPTATATAAAACRAVVACWRTARGTIARARG